MFHTSGWLAALQQTYDYEPIVFTTSPPEERLRNGLVFCKVKSWVTGRRLVSLPFSDHCALLADTSSEQEELLSHFCERASRDGYTHAEIRPKNTGDSVPLAAANLEIAERFCLHALSLDPPLDVLFHNLHKDCIQRKIHRAQKEHLSYESGRTEPLLRTFYQLLMRTRRRQLLPPQPLKWFRNLVKSMGENLTIRIVSKDHCPVAAMLTLSHKTTLTFKYGCSDERFQNLGGTPFLFWKAIQEAKDQGLRELDLGRSAIDHTGLIQFKDRLGAVKTVLPYWRGPSGRAAAPARLWWKIRMTKGIMSWIPEPVLVASGRFLYRHIG
ncbi:MAG TPA: GNAT family N-acetyltransferase [Candidatus Acidoferrales bacterium]|nr:GNAT family N-acetyltransferase [Candidatus Acidoferrales bacterium]